VYIGLDGEIVLVNAVPVESVLEKNSMLILLKTRVASQIKRLEGTKRSLLTVSVEIMRWKCLEDKEEQAADVLPLVL
jgi:hypothetical protein